MTIDELKLVISSEEKTLVKFGASWCGPCKIADIILKQVIEAGSTRVVIIDVEDNVEIGSKYQIRTLPTFIIFQKGEVIERFSKRPTKIELINKLK